MNDEIPFRCTELVRNTLSDEVIAVIKSSRTRQAQQRMAAQENYKQERQKEEMINRIAKAPDTWQLFCEFSEQQKLDTFSFVALMFCEVYGPETSIGEIAEDLHKDE